MAAKARFFSRYIKKKVSLTEIEAKKHSKNQLKWLFK
jgi:hypothetical protein